MSSSDYQDIIDEYKEQIPDELYRQICLLNMDKYKKENEEVERIYKIRYVTPHMFYCTANDETYIQNKFRTKLVKLKRKFFTKISENINKDGYCGSYLAGKIVIERKTKNVTLEEYSLNCELERDIISIELA